MCVGVSHVRVHANVSLLLFFVPEYVCVYLSLSVNVSVCFLLPMKVLLFIILLLLYFLKTRKEGKQLKTVCTVIFF